MVEVDVDLLLWRFCQYLSSSSPFQSPSTRASIMVKVWIPPRFQARSALRREGAAPNKGPAVSIVTQGKSHLRTMRHNGGFARHRLQGRAQ